MVHLNTNAQKPFTGFESRVAPTAGPKPAGLRLPGHNRLSTVAPRLLLLSLVAIGCSSGESDPEPNGDLNPGAAPDPNDAADPTPDDDSSGADEACPAAGSPSGPNLGDFFPDEQVADCDDPRQRHSLKDLRCAAELTVFSIGAGWCIPCREETPLLQDVHTLLEPLGAQVVQVMFQDERAELATTTFCGTWRDQFELTLPLFIDPLENSFGIFESPAVPVNIIVDRAGRILWKSEGVIPENLESILRQGLEDPDSIKDIPPPEPE